MTYSVWQRIVDETGLTEGPTVKHVNERWTIDDVPIAIGSDGVQLCMLMPTATWGWTLWENGVRKYAIARLEDFEDALPSDAPPGPEDWQRHTACQVIGVDEKHRNELMAFVSTAKGGRDAFKSLMPGYARKGEQQFPIVVLGSKMQKGDKRDYVVPTLSIVGWAPRDDFKDFLPPPRPPREAPARLLAPPMQTPPPDEGELARADPADDIPF